MTAKKTSYLLIGNGRLAKHFRYYLDLLSVSYAQWWRGSGHDLTSLLTGVDKVLLLISDDAIIPFIQAHQQKQTGLTWIHCSGTLETPLAEGLHPLMTFGDSFYDLRVYQSIPFVSTAGRMDLRELFPELINPSTTISSTKKTLYHAWASMAGNLSAMLWTTYFQRLEQEFQIDRQLVEPYLNQVFLNIQSSQTPMTGPLVRGDTRTIEAHLGSLEKDPFRAVYSAFVEAYGQASQHEETA